VALANDPKAWILRLFEMEEREGRGANCQRFPDGSAPPGIPIVEGERVYGIYKDKFYFTPQSFIMKSGDAFVRTAWAEIERCSSRHGEGKKTSELLLVDGRTLTVPVGQMAQGWSGRISQLFHQMIEKHGAKASFGLPLYSVDQFFSAADSDYCFAPNLEPHPALADVMNALSKLAERPGTCALFLNVVEVEAGVPIADGVVIRTRSPSADYEDFARSMGAGGIIEAPLNILRKLESLSDGERAWLVVWD
jgi:hypothetical protein